jgi:hypothetical protein
MKIVRTRRYLSDLRRMKVTDEERDRLEAAIAANPAAGDVIPGLKGIRKLRFSFGGRGKRGGGRAVYFRMVADDAVAMLFAYGKNEKEDLTAAEKNAALRMMKEIDGG